MSYIRIFGYGNLVNPRELRNTLPSKEAIGLTRLRGWQMVLAKPGLTHAYATLVEKPDWEVMGVIIEITPPELATLAQREAGYALVDVTERIVDKELIGDTQVYVFVSPTVHALHVRGSYLENILVGLPDDETRKEWLDMVDLEGRTIDYDRPELPFLKALLPRP